MVKSWMNGLEGKSRANEQAAAFLWDCLDDFELEDGGVLEDSLAADWTKCSSAEEDGDLM